MKKVYICSPYRAKDGAELDRNIDYAQELTRKAIEAGLAPITPHLYITQCLDEDKPEERAKGMAAGLELLKSCDYVIVGTKYGISEGMRGEINEAAKAKIKIIEETKLRQRLEDKRRECLTEYASENRCEHCCDTRLQECRYKRTGGSGDKDFVLCNEAYRRAYKYAEEHFTGG